MSAACHMASTAKVACHARIRWGAYTVGCHRRTVRSFDAEAICPVTLLKSTSYTLPCIFRSSQARMAYCEAVTDLLHNSGRSKRMTDKKTGHGAAHLVAYKSICSKLGFKVPNHYTVVKRPRHQLLHGGVERHTRDGISMATERPFQGWILWLHT